MTAKLLPPLNKHLTKLNRDLFKKTVKTSAIKVHTEACSRLLLQLRKEQCLLNIKRVKPVVDTSDSDFKYLLMDFTVTADSLNPQVKQILSKEKIEWIDYEITLTYDYWTTDKILEAILPDNMDVPSSFETVGHIAHVNLRAEQLEYKHIIGQVILDKNKNIKTVVNKLDSIDHTFRFFKMEVLAGEQNFITTVRECDCNFQMDYSKVYWNSRLQSEHNRLVKKFSPDDVIFDVFGGIGPFALPAAKSNCIVFCNDLNPSSFEWLCKNIKQNKLSHRVVPFNLDGRQFIRASLELVSDESTWKSLADHHHKLFKKSAEYTVTKSPSHYVMNLPATAIEFLDAFNGLFHGSNSVLPMIHCYCFSNADDMEADVIQRAGKALDYPLKREEVDEIYRVRDVSPKKQMLCLSFRLPEKVAKNLKRKSQQ